MCYTANIKLNGEVYEVELAEWGAELSVNGKTLLKWEEDTSHWDERKYAWHNLEHLGIKRKYTNNKCKKHLLTLKKNDLVNFIIELIKQ